MISGFKIYSDHHSYTEKDLDQLMTSAHGRGAPGLLTTEKDITKVRNVYKNILPVFTLPTEFNDNHDFNQYIRQNLDK
jgi:tetraacyldisaccharide-1-P 4'-kinase